MEEIYSYFLKKEKENGDILIKDFLPIFVMLKLNFLGGGRDGGDSMLYKFYFYMILKNKNSFVQSLTIRWQSWL